MIQENQSNTNSEPLYQLLTGAQSSLYAFICSLLGGSVYARDVLQETNLVLWEKADEYDHSREFLPWAFKFAHMQVLAFRKRQQREKLAFGDDLVDKLAAEFSGHASSTDARLEALDNCVNKLSTSQRELIRKFYGQNTSLADIGRMLGKQAGAVAANLYRIRRALYKCVELTLRSEGTS